MPPSDLFAPLTPAEFRAQHWPDTPFVTHGSRDRLGALAECAALADAASVLDVHPAKIRVWLTGPDRKLRKLREVAPADAKSFVLSEVGTVVVDEVDAHIEPVDALMRGCCELLGVARENAACNAYLSPAGAGTRMHFDQQEVIVLQLGGRKRWRFCANEQVRFPVRPYFGNRIPPELAALASSFPDEMPSGAQEVTLEPGSLLFLPRGYWHETETLDASVSLTLTFAVPPWMEVVLDYLRSALLLREDWRRPAFGLDESGTHRERISAMLEARLDDLRGLLAETSPGRVLPPLRDAPVGVGPGGRLVPVPNVRWELEQRDDDGHAQTVLVLGSDDGPVEIGILPGLTRLCTWLAARAEPFTTAEAHAAAGEAPRRAVDVLLRVALRCGALARIDE
ncbi:JmjC domain-containing protein [Haliangium sp.]